MTYTRPALELLLTLPGPRRTTKLCKTEVLRSAADMLACCPSSSYYTKCHFILVEDTRFSNWRRPLRDKRWDHWFIRTGYAYKWSARHCALHSFILLEDLRPASLVVDSFLVGNMPRLLHEDMKETMVQDQGIGTSYPLSVVLGSPSRASSIPWTGCE